MTGPVKCQIIFQAFDQIKIIAASGLYQFKLSLVQVINVGLMVKIMVKMQCCGADYRFQCVIRVGQRW